VPGSGGETFALWIQERELLVPSYNSFTASLLTSCPCRPTILLAIQNDRTAWGLAVKALIQHHKNNNSGAALNRTEGSTMRRTISTGRGG